MLRSFLIAWWFLSVAAILPRQARAQSSLDLLKGSSDAGQQVFDQRSGGSASLDTNQVYPASAVSERPLYPGSEAALLRSLTTAEGCGSGTRDGACMSTLVIVRFVVERDGTTSDHKAVNEDCPFLRTTALCAMQNMSTWTPGKLNGKAVRVQMQIPVRYELR